MSGIIGSVLGGLFGGGGGGGGSNPLASLLAGQLTSQRIPGQTRAGEYTPPEGGFGTYNYIPTGASQIDPALIQQIMSLMNMNSSANNTAGPLNNSLLQQGTNNPYAAGAQTGANNAGAAAGTQAGYIGMGQNWLGGNYQPVWDSALNNLSNYQRLNDSAQNNPMAQGYINNSGNIGQNLMQAGSGIQNTATGALDTAQNLAGTLLQNPYSGQAQGAANTAGGMMQGAGQQGYNTGQMFSGQAAAGLPAASSILNTAFDPQNALYNQTRQRTEDQLGTFLARTGTTDSGVGAQFASDRLRDFNIDWQNNQLGRQTQGLQSYTQGVAGAGQNLNTGTGMQTQGAQNYAAGGALPYQTYQGIGSGNLDAVSQLANLARTTAGTTGQAGDIQLGGAAAGNNAYMQSLSQQLPFASGLNTGMTGMNNTYQNMGNTITNSANLGGTQVNQLMQQGQLPYGASQQNYNNMYGALSNYLSGGTSMSNLGIAPLGPSFNYLGAVNAGSNSAANAATGAQSNTMNQNAQSAAGLSPFINTGLNALSNWLQPSGRSSFNNTFGQTMNFG